MLSVLHHSSPDGSLRSLISYKEGVTATEESEARLGEMRHDRLLLMVNDLSLRFRSFLIPLSLVIHPRNRSQGNGDRMNWSETRPSDYNSLQEAKPGDRHRKVPVSQKTFHGLIGYGSYG